MFPYETFYILFHIWYSFEYYKIFLQIRKIKLQKITIFSICEIFRVLFFTNKDPSQMKWKVFYHYVIYVPHEKVKMAETKKKFLTGVVLLDPIYHPSKFLPSLKKHPVYKILREKCMRPVLRSKTRFRLLATTKLWKF